MYVCICNAITDSDVHQAVEGGVRNMRDLAAQTGCSQSCGRCARTAAEVLRDALHRTAPNLRVVRPDQAA